MSLKPCAHILRFLLAFALTLLVNAQSTSLPSSWPQVYPGMPSGDYSPAWQAYFQVTNSLPNVTWPLARNWAGNIPVQREGHPNNTLFFWAFESSNGSFTATSDEPWGIWLNGGPGSSSLVGLLFENGPIHISSNYSLSENQHSWTNVADYVWIDQPVGAGFSTVDSDGYIYDEDQMASDFMGFLNNFVKVFPNLASRPLHITGESYAGMYIPYIAKAYFEMDNPPIKLAKIAMGDGTINSEEVIQYVPVLNVLETYPQIIGYDTDVFEYFREQTRLCGYDITLQYPQPEPFPTLPYITGYDPISLGGTSRKYNARLTMQDFMLEAQNRYAEKLAKRDGGLSKRQRIRARKLWKRSLAGRANGTIDPQYGCDLYDEMIDYAINFTFPWSLSEGSRSSFDPFDIPDALNPEVPMDASVFLNNAQTRAAIHAPTSQNWAEIIIYPFGNGYSLGDISAAPMSFLTDLATNATAHNMTIIVYSGNDDALIPHFGSQVTIQNTTFGGIRGFTRKPETPWYNDAGEFAGIVHQERGWTYLLVAHASHLVGYSNPDSALVLVREFIFGNNQTGLVTNTTSGSVTVVGGEVSSLGSDVMTGQAGIYYGSATTASTYLFPTATVEAWNEFMATASPSATGSKNSATRSGRASSIASNAFVFGVVLTIVFTL